jgi:hypothetical protein
MRAGFRRNQLRIDSDRFAGAAHAAFQDVAHAEFAADRFHVDGLAL